MRPPPCRAAAERILRSVPPSVTSAENAIALGAAPQTARQTPFSRERMLLSTGRQASCGVTMLTPPCSRSLARAL
eukprot:5915651-Pyramimonas_sp.AAC.1